MVTVEPTPNDGRQKFKYEVKCNCGFHGRSMNKPAADVVALRHVVEHDGEQPARAWDPHRGKKTQVVPGKVKV